MKPNADFDISNNGPEDCKEMDQCSIDSKAIKPTDGLLKENSLDTSTQQAPQTSLKLIDGVSVIFGLMVGSGIFSSAGLVYADVGSSGMSLVVWLTTGLLALTGALCYAELGTMIPGSGGEAPYLEKGFGSWATFIFNWTSIILLKPGGTAVIAVAFAKYVMMMFLSNKLAGAIDSENSLVAYKWPIKGVALGCCAAVTLLSAISHTINRRTQLGLTGIKIFSLALVIIAGFIYLFMNTSFAKANLSNPFKGTIWSVSLYASAFNHGLWAFEGWNNLNLVAGDLKNPSKNLPLSIWISVCMVICLYLLTLLGYFFTLPAAIISNSETIGVAFGRSVMGKAGAIIMPLLISICIFGACLSGMSTSAEVVIFASRMGHFPSIFGNINATLSTALNAYVLQCTLSMIMVLASDFNVLVHIYTFPAWLFYGSSVIALLILRWKDPNAPRPYKVWITTPVIFLIACVLLMVSSFWAQPLPIGLSLIILLLGLPFYYFFVRENACCPIKRRQIPESQEMAETM